MGRKGNQGKEAGRGDGRKDEKEEREREGERGAQGEGGRGKGLDSESVLQWVCMSGNRQNEL